VELTDRQRELLGRQLAMNGQTWETLQRHGVTEETELRLDFFYVAPAEKQAEGLAEFLTRETDYEVRVQSQPAGLLKGRTWAVVGRTQETKISRDVLDHWARWMVGAGLASECEFDGWGAQAPPAR
jgi:Regulator of ribonuclease activity B